METAPVVAAPTTGAVTRVRTRVRHRTARAFAVLGPGLIAAAAGNDAGGIARKHLACGLNLRIR